VYITPWPVELLITLNDPVFLDLSLQTGESSFFKPSM